MKKETTSKVWLIRQQGSDSPGNKFNLPVEKQFLFEFRDGSEIHNTETSSGMRPIAFPVGFVIEHDESWGVHEQYSDNFEVVNNIISYPIYTGVDVSHLEGELLTIIDAAFSEKEQRESIKSLVRNTIWGFNHRQEKKIQAMYESVKNIE